MKRFATVVLFGALAAPFGQLALAQQSDTWRESAAQSCGDDDGVRCANARANRGGEGD